MDTLDFVRDVPAEKLILIFKEYFEEHMLAFDLLHGLEFLKLNSIDIDNASIMYSVRLLNEDDKEKIVDHLNSKAGSLEIYGKHYKPNIFINGDLLCITISK